MKLNHTLGPWFAVQYANQWAIQSMEGYEGSIYDVLDEEADDNAEANANLITAAPELLSCLMQWATENGIDVNNPNTGGYSKLAANTINAIQRATGGQP